ncbi:DISEASE RESISTANCE PROTEIN RP [Salix koriyanagi]|uniref:DISEASE RESISTANCE PROTEIN RP n=1 Tax=Salix koriyanagi TaxID=2511006 RepID=A0A9Q0Q867_9ROSI|nr:DISEASE RESISTANCE PROTEIN RP [Salix koriyanagi]
MSELGRLIHLRRLGILKFRKEDGRDLCSSIDKLMKLRALSVTTITESEVIDLEVCPIWCTLNFVQVYSGEALHFSHKGFIKLKVLGLNKLERLKSITVQKGALPSLQKLVVEGCKLLQKVPSGIKHLATLKALDFFDMPHDFVKRLRPDGTEQRAARSFLRMPAVQFIKILQMLPFDMPYDFTRKIHPGGDGEDYHEVRKCA